MDDTEMAAALAGCVSCPYPGTWQGSPFAERTVGGVRYGVVALDPGLSALGVRRADGSLWGLPEEGVPHLVNSGVEAFVASPGPTRRPPPRPTRMRVPTRTARRKRS
ncbi:hypothetical protein [Streptomyces xiamenensis]|uniref:hypothetical protein n=1 Tax=Streptomyces xiamenensis TaxID=408015 RepID=UPI0035E2FA1D